MGHYYTVVKNFKAEKRDYSVATREELPFYNLLRSFFDSTDFQTIYITWTDESLLVTKVEYQMSDENDYMTWYNKHYNNKTYIQFCTAIEETIHPFIEDEWALRKMLTNAALELSGSHHYKGSLEILRAEVQKYSSNVQNAAISHLKNFNPMAIDMWFKSI